MISSSLGVGRARAFPADFKVIFADKGRRRAIPQREVLPRLVDPEDFSTRIEHGDVHRHGVQHTRGDLFALPLNLHCGVRRAESSKVRTGRLGSGRGGAPLSFGRQGRQTVFDLCLLIPTPESYQQVSAVTVFLAGKLRPAPR